MDGIVLADGGRISGATNSTLNISATQPTDSGSYRAVVTDKYGYVVPSMWASLLVLSKPGIAIQPVDNLVAPEFLNVNLSVTATGAPPLFYQWQKNGTNLGNAANFSGADSPNLTLSSPQPADSGRYSAVVTNAFGMVASSNAMLTVVPLFLWGDTSSLIPPGATNVVAVSAGGDVNWG